jgi:hypothetical protein
MARLHRPPGLTRTRPTGPAPAPSARSRGLVHAHIGAVALPPPPAAAFPIPESLPGFRDRPPPCPPRGRWITATAASHLVNQPGIRRCVCAWEGYAPGAIGRGNDVFGGWLFRREASGLDFTAGAGLLPM